MTAKDLEQIMTILAEKYPEPETELNFSTPFELLVATILSAQSTDKQVNKVTERLFKKYNKPEDFANLERRELEKEINSIGLYRNKSKYIIETSKILLDKYGGRVPATRRELTELPGVGRKTANVLLACAFARNAIPVDTHVFRVANRLGLANSDRVDQVEEELMKAVPEDSWADMHHWLIFHGRRTCKARNPECNRCELKVYCKYYRERSK